MCVWVCRGAVYQCRLFVSVCLCGIFIAVSPTWRQMRNRKWACMEGQQLVKNHLHQHLSLKCVLCYSVICYYFRYMLQCAFLGACWVVLCVSPRCSDTGCRKSWSGQQGCAELFPGCWTHIHSSSDLTEAEGGYVLAMWLDGPCLPGPGCPRWGESEDSPGETEKCGRE